MVCVCVCERVCGCVFVAWGGSESCAVNSKITPQACVCVSVSGGSESCAVNSKNTPQACVCECVCQGALKTHPKPVVTLSHGIIQPQSQRNETEKEKTSVCVRVQGIV